MAVAQAQLEDLELAMGLDSRVCTQPTQKGRVCPVPGSEPKTRQALEELRSSSVVTPLCDFIAVRDLPVGEATGTSGHVTLFFLRMVR